jgi:multisubunit Na+/H+ antiporter MnhC subunit
VLTSAVGEIAALGTAAEAIARSDPYASHGFSPTVVALVLGAVVLVIAGLTLALAYALRRLRRPAAAAANVNPIGREE